MNRLDPAVRAFLVQFRQSIVDQNVADIQAVYEGTFNKLTERFFEKTPWPAWEVVAPVVEQDGVFSYLYKELYYRHVYYKLKPTLDHRFKSFENYCDLFRYILRASFLPLFSSGSHAHWRVAESDSQNAAPVPLELPPHWLWDIIDEFIYQFQTFCQFRANLEDRTDAEIEMLKEKPAMWNVHSVLNILHSLIEKSQIQEQLIAMRNGTDVACASPSF